MMQKELRSTPGCSHGHPLFCSHGCSVMLLSRAIGDFLFPTYEVVITSLSYSSAFMSEIIKCSIQLVDHHKNIHRTMHAVCWKFCNFGKIHDYFTAYKAYYTSNDVSYLAYKYTTLATRQRDVVVVRTSLTAAMVVPSTMFKVYDAPNSETGIKIISKFPCSKYDLRGRSHPISD